MTDTLTVNGVEYEVDETQTNEGTSIFKIEQFEGLEARVGYEQDDASAFNPREWDNVGTMSVHYDRYNLGDEDIADINWDVTCPKCEGNGESDHWIVGIHATAERLVIGSEEECQEWLDNQPDVESGRYYIEPLACDKCKGEGEVRLDPLSYFRQERGARVVLPLCVYEHSGITMYVGKKGDYPFDSQGWDTSFVGFIFDTPEAVKTCIGDDATDEQITAALEAEVKTYADYLEGDVTWWSVDDTESGFGEGCGGYVGDHKHTKQECFESLESAVLKRLTEDSERAYWKERGVMTVDAT